MPSGCGAAETGPDRAGGDDAKSAAREHTNVIITPHIGGATDRSIADARLASARKLAHYLRTGEELIMA